MQNTSPDLGCEVWVWFLFHPLLLLLFGNILPQNWIRQFLKKLNIELPYDPAILLRWSPKELETGTRSGACAPVFAAVPFSRAKRWEQPQSPPTDEQINTPWRHKTELQKNKKSYSALRENEDRYMPQYGWSLQTLSEREQEKCKDCLSPLIGNTRRVKFTETESSTGTSSPCTKCYGNRNLLLNGYNASVWSDFGNR